MDGEISTPKLKRKLQLSIDSGDIGSRKELMAVVKRLGLQITRNGAKYLGMKNKDGKRFRVHFDFDALAVAPLDRPRPIAIVETVEVVVQKSEVIQASLLPRVPVDEARKYWIYALVASSADMKQRACYIGLTRRPRERMRMHEKRRGDSCASAFLFDWAERKGLAVHGLLLQNFVGNIRHAYALETHFLKLFVAADFLTPGVHQWGNLKLRTLPPEGSPASIDAELILGAAMPWGEFKKHPRGRKQTPRDIN